MSMRIVLIALSCLVGVGMAATASGTLGADVAVAANDETTITYPLGLQLVVTLSAAGSVNLDTFAMADLAAGVSIPSGFSQINFGGVLNAEVGWKFEVKGGAGLVSAKLKTPTLSAAALVALKTEGVVPGILHYDASTETFTAVAVDEFDSSALAPTITFHLPKTGSYIVASMQTSIQASFAVPKHIVANANQSLYYGASKTSGFVLEIRSETNNQVTVTKKTASDKGTEAQRAALGVLMNVYFDVSLAANAAHQSTLKYYFTAQELADAGIEASAAANLRFAYYDEADAAWVFPSSGGSVDTSARVVTQATTHFSEWTVAAQSGVGALAPHIAVLGVTVAALMTSLLKLF